MSESYITVTIDSVEPDRFRRLLRCVTVTSTGYIIGEFYYGTYRELITEDFKLYKRKIKGVFKSRQITMTWNWQGDIGGISYDFRPCHRAVYTSIIGGEQWPSHFARILWKIYSHKLQHTNNPVELVRTPAECGGWYSLVNPVSASTFT